MEMWKPIPGYEGIYEASNLGCIRSAPGKITSNAQYEKRVWKIRVLKPKHIKSKRRQDYRVSLWKDGTVKDALVARLVASTWLGVPAEGMTVNHINGDWSDNRIENLEWVTLAENIQKGFASGQYASVQKAVTISDEDGNEYSFVSMSSMDRFLGRHIGYTSQALKLGSPITSAINKKYTVVKRQGE